MNRTPWLPTLFFTMFAMITMPAQAEPESLLWSPAHEAESAAGTETRLSLDAALLAGAPEAIRIQLPSGRTVRAERVEVEHRGPGRLTWRGRLQQGSVAAVDVTLTLFEGRVHGSLFTSDGSYWLAPASDAGEHRLVRFSDAEAFTCGGGVVRGRQIAPSPEPSAPGPKAMPVIDFLIFYSTAFRDQRGGVAAAEAQVQSAVDQFTTTLRNSDIPGRGRLLHVAVTNRLGGQGGTGASLDLLERDAAVRQLRNQLGADVVALFITPQEGTGSCNGIAGLMGRSAFNSGRFAAFSVTGCDIPGGIDRIFTHEVGHNLGGNHARGQDTPTSQAVFPWAFAFDGQVRSIMAGGGSPTPVPYFSSPNLTVQGTQIGVPEQVDNRRALLQTVPFQAAFDNAEPPSAPSAPAALTAEVLSATEVVLRWQDRANNEQEFRIESKVGDGTFEEISTVPANTQEAVLNGLQAATVYTFRVRARGAGGFSAYSGEAHAQTPAALPVAPGELTAVPFSESAVELTWADTATNETGFVIEISSASFPFQQVATAAADEQSVVVGALAAATPYTFRVRAENAAGASPYSGEASATTGGREGACGESAEDLCLLGGRFEIRLAWRNPRAPFQNGQAEAGVVAGSDLTGLFTFFGEGRIEVLVKMLDGRVVNNAFWLFFGSLSDLEFWLTARDTATGATRTFHNPPREICGGADTGAFLEAAAGVLDVPRKAVALPFALTGAPEAMEGDCVPDAGTQCLLDGRFAVEVEWANPRVEGDAGSGRVVPTQTTSESGFFWFFQPQNLELAVKLIDGRAVNDKFWFFWGALTDVAYTIRVTDTVANETATYTNEAFNICGGADTAAF